MAGFDFYCKFPAKRKLKEHYGDFDCCEFPAKEDAFGEGRLPHTGVSVISQQEHSAGATSANRRELGTNGPD